MFILHYCYQNGYLEPQNVFDLSCRFKILLLPLNFTLPCLFTNLKMFWFKETSYKLLSCFFRMQESCSALSLVECSRKKESSTLIKRKNLVFSQKKPRSNRNFFENAIFELKLTHFTQCSISKPIWKRHKTKGFLTFSGGIEMEHWAKMG